MFWEVSGVDTEVIRLLWSLPFWNTPPGYSFSGYLFPSLYPLGHFCFLSLVSVYCFRLWFLTVVPVSNTQGKTPSVPGSTITLVLIPVIPMPQVGSARSDLPAGGQEEFGGVSHSERMMADMMKMLANLTIQNQQLLLQHLQQNAAAAGDCGVQQQTAGAADNRGLQQQMAAGDGGRVQESGGAR